MSSPLGGGALLGVRKGGPSHPRPKPVLRNVRLEIPEAAANRIQVSRSREQRSGSFSYSQRPDFSAFCTIQHETEEINLYAPSVLLEFPCGTSPAFLYEVYMPGSAQAFATHPPCGLTDPRFLLYLVSQDGLSQGMSAISINGTNVLHVVGDGRPIDATDLLQPFGHENWIIADPNKFCSPFVAIGVWANRKSLDEMLSEIALNHSFAAPPSFDICPVSRSIVNIPGRGVNCRHEECFDAACFLTQSIALEQWICPVCGIDLPLDDLMVDMTRNRVAEKTSDGSAEWKDEYAFGFEFGS